MTSSYKRHCSTYEDLNWSTDITSMNKGVVYLCSFILVLNSVHPVLGVNLSWSMYSLTSECRKKEIHYFPATYIKNMFSIVSRVTPDTEAQALLHTISIYSRMQSAIG